MDRTAADNDAGLLLAATLAPLETGPRRALARLKEMAFRYVQLSAAQAGLRPRELDRSARRDLLATLRRYELLVSGIDLWIPPSHFTDDGHVDRAVETALGAIDLAGDLGRCPVSLLLPPEVWDVEQDRTDVGATLLGAAERTGVALADHAVPPRQVARLGIGIDPVRWLVAGEDPAQGVLAAGPRLASIRLADQLASGVRGPIGDPHEGQLDVAAYHGAVAACGWRGPIVVDARQWASPWPGLARTVQAWRSVTAL